MIEIRENQIGEEHVTGQVVNVTLWCLLVLKFFGEDIQDDVNEEEERRLQ